MPQITTILPQKKKKGRFNVYLDGRFAFGADEEVVARYHLAINQNLSTKQIEEIIKDTQINKLLDKVLRFLSFRPKSQKEVTDYLAKKIAAESSVKFIEAQDSPLIGKVISKLKKYNYLNDKEFAKFWIASRIKTKPKGRLQIARELKMKGVDKEIIESLLSRFPDELSLAQKAIEKKLPKWQRLPEPEFKKKIYTYLVGRGFNYETISELFAFFKKRR